MIDRDRDHVAAGWDAGDEFRWIEAGRLRLVEDDKGAHATVQGPSGPTWLSATELAGLACHLAAWFVGDDTVADKIRLIEACARRVHGELEAWNARARADEEHPPYDELTRALDVLLGACRDLREMPVLADGEDVTPC